MDEDIYHCDFRISQYRLSQVIRFDYQSCLHCRFECDCLIVIQMNIQDNKFCKYDVYADGWSIGIQPIC